MPAVQRETQLRIPGRIALLMAAVATCLLAAGCTRNHHDTAALESAAVTGLQPTSPAGPVSSSAPAHTSPAPVSSAVASAPAATSPTPTRPPSASARAMTTSPSARSATASAKPSATSQAAQAAAVPDVWVATATTVTAAQLGKSWHAGKPECPVGPAQLRNLTMTYWGFDGRAHMGTLVINASVVPAVTQAFRTLFAEHFPIRTMIPISAFGASDPASTAADNTAAFNCRYAVANGPPKWSAHAYGEAIDINTVENPYVFNGQVLPSQGAAYAKRSPYRPGMAVPGGQLVDAFKAMGWSWGGLWTSAPDYQHFSLTGN